MKISRNNKGFTLIELLVVIAIIGILSSIVLSSLTTARLKGQEAAIQSQFSGMRSQAELYYGSNNNKYTATIIGPANCDTTASNIFGSNVDNGLGQLIDGVKSSYSGSNPQCFASSTAWSVSATLPEGSVWCADSTGKSASTTVDSATNLCQ